MPAPGVIWEDIWEDVWGDIWAAELVTPVEDGAVTDTLNRGAMTEARSPGAVTDTLNRGSMTGET